MSLLTRAHLLDKYGPRLSMDQLAECLNLHPATIYNLLSRGDLKIQTYKEGNRRFAAYEAVAEYLERMAGTAKVGGTNESQPV